MQIEKFPLVNLNEVWLNNYLKELHLNIDLCLNTGICIVPEYYDELLTTFTTFELAIAYRPAIIILHTQMMHEPLKEMAQFKVPNSAEEITKKISESFRFVEICKKLLEKNLFKLFVEEPDYETYVFGQFNFGLLKGGLKCGI